MADPFFFNSRLTFPDHDDHGVVELMNQQFPTTDSVFQHQFQGPPGDFSTPLKPVFYGENSHYKEVKRIETMIHSTPESSCSHSASLNVGGGKRKKKKTEYEHHKDVIHVRARRGQATDSHSLAERARRGKINERLKLLQDIVPGCYKSMGMVVMLDETISYVQSLRNQIEFLSMQLASVTGSESDADAMQQCLATSCFNSGYSQSHPHQLVASPQQMDETHTFP